MRCVAALVSGVLLLCATACGDDDRTIERAEVAPTTTSTATTGTTPAPPSSTTTTAPAVAPVAWEPCGRAECATVVVPVDHADPAGATIELFATRLPATGERIGPLFVNFGGPGADAAETVTRFPFPDEVRERFDIVAVDPRGVGRSTPLDCGLAPAELYALDPTIEDPADAAALLEASRRYADDCAARAGDLLDHIGTRDVARDIDLVRRAMGDEQLSFLGYSYGTSIGQAYAAAFPDRVRAMILDGVVDPAPPGVEVAVQQAAGFEAALASWAGSCPSRRSCPVDDALGAVDDVLARAESGIASSRGGRALGPGEAAVALAYPLYDESLWDDLDRAVGAARAGDGGPMVDLADDYLRVVAFPAYFAVSCVDAAWPAAPEEHLAAGETAARAAPHFGEAIVNDYVRCAVWPAEPDPLGPITAPGTPPILVVSTTGDPATPHANGVRVAERLEAAALLTHEGEGHTIVFQGSDCVDAVAVAYLTELRTPADGARC